MAKQRVPRTRAGGLYTESMYWGKIRQHLRRGLKTWPPKNKARNKAIIDWYESPVFDKGTGKPIYYVRGPKKGLQKVKKKPVLQCANCGHSYREEAKMIEMDHKVACGSLRNANDLVGWVERAYCEEVGFWALCKPCHKVKTAEDREKTKAERKKK